jgi:acetamidase/formamidase
MRAMGGRMSEHTLDRSLIHHDWDNAREPVLTIRSGDVVHLDLLMAGHGQVAEDSKIEDVVWDFDTIYNLAGPIRVEGARAGDTLEVEILSLTPGAWGWTSIIPGLGLLPDEFPDAYLRIWDLRNGTTTMLGDTVRLPLTSFLGTMGVALDEPGSVSPFPPHRGGGNMDTRHLVQGSTLWLPIWCDGALYSCGDAHAGQGDGEVCVSAIECDMQATLRLSVVQRTLDAPSFRVPAAAQRAPRAYHGTMGIDPDLMVGAQKAVRAMIGWIVDEHGLAPIDAYVLTSVAGDLHIHEIVDAGVWNVGMTLPLDVFL